MSCEGGKSILHLDVTEVTGVVLQSLNNWVLLLVEKNILSEFTYVTFNSAVGAVSGPICCADSS
jgi:hypothetical protein